MPVNRLVPYATYVNSSTPSPNAEFLNDYLQGGLVGLFTGVLSRFGIVIDGVGGATAVPAAGQIKIGGKASDAVPTILGTDAPAGFSEALTFPIGGGKFARLHHVNGEGWFATVNAKYTSGGTPWARDAAGDAYGWYLDSGGFGVNFYPAASASPWANASWLDRLVVDFGGDVTASRNIVATEDVVATRALEAQTARSSATAGAGQSVSAGRAFKEGLPIAWAHVTNNGITASLVRGYNIASVSRSALGKVAVELNSGGANMIAPVPAIVGNTMGLIAVASTNLDATGFEVWTKLADNSLFGDYDFTVQVFGG